MEWNDLLLRLRALLFPARHEKDLEDELQIHLEFQTRKYLASGIPRCEAEQRARRELGAWSLIKEECRDARGTLIIENFPRDVRYALRDVRRSPAFALTVLLTMAVAIGSNVTIFSFCKAMLLRKLPVPRADHLHLLEVVYPRTSFSYFSFPDLREMQQASSQLAALTGFTENFDVHIANKSGTMSTIQAQLVTGNFFSVLQVSPFAGRTFKQVDNQAGAEPVAAISYRFWQRRFAGARSALGQQVRIQQTPMTIVAIMPADFEGVEPGTSPDLWMPLAAQARIGFGGYASGMNHIDWKKPWLLQDVSWLHVLARSSKADRLNAVLDRLVKKNATEHLPQVTDPEQRAMMLSANIRLTDGSAGLPRLREQFLLPLRILFLLVGVLLFSGCINLSNLLVVRSRSRGHEIALRLALGSSRGRLISQLLTETLLLTVAGGLLSIPLAYGSGQAVLAWLRMAQTSLALDVTPDRQIFAFAAAVTLVCGLAIGLLPSLRHFGFGLSSVLGQRSQTASGSASRRVGVDVFMLGAQIALSVVSLIVAGLLSHTLLNYARMDIGVDRTHVLSVSLDPSAAGYTNAQRGNALYRDLTAVIDRIPGVISSAVSGCGLMNGCIGTLGIQIPGREAPSGRDLVAQRNYVGAGYLSTVGVHLLQGREIDQNDTANAPLAAVVNQTFEAQLLNGKNALGQVIVMEGQGIVIRGVAKDARSNDIHHLPLPLLYLPVEQAPGGWNISRIQVRAAGNPLALASEVRQAIARINRAIPVAEITTLSEETRRNLARELLVGRLAGVFSLLTLLVAALGLYGVLAYQVAQRPVEIGVRMALGADRSDVVRLIFQRAALVLAAGTVTGLLLSLSASRLVASLLFGTTQLDLLAYGGSLSVLLLAALSAATVPAWRASRVDPAEALREN